MAEAVLWQRLLADSEHLPRAVVVARDRLAMGLVRPEQLFDVACVVASVRVHGPRLVPASQVEVAGRALAVAWLAVV